MTSSSSILVAPYAFKGVLSSSEAAEAIAAALSTVVPPRTLMQLSLGDGGSGTLDALVTAAGGEIRWKEVTQATGERGNTRWGMLRNGHAVMEAAECIALARVPESRRHPDLLTTVGVGELVLAAVQAGSASLTIGLGDSATHDCGIGMASTLGYRLLDRQGRPLEPIGASLAALAAIEASPVFSFPTSFHCIGLCDVMNPLSGPDGAARRFASQKGADPKTVEILEEGSLRFAEIVRRDLGTDVTAVAGAGAAGGLGAGLVAFLHADLVSGAEAVLDAVGFDDLLKQCDAVVTGEGRVDGKTLLGKGVAHVARRAAAQGVRCVIVAGSIEGEREVFERELSATIIPLNDERPTSESVRQSIVSRGVELRDAMG